MGPGALSAVNNLVCALEQLPALPPATLASVQPEAGLGSFPGPCSWEPVSAKRVMWKEFPIEQGRS